MRIDIAFDTRIRLAFAVVAVLLLSIVGFQCVSLHRSVLELKAAANDNVQWGLMQVEAEHFRLAAAFKDLESDDPRSVDAFRKRFDIYYSRVDLLRTGSEFERVRSIPVLAGDLARISGSLQTIADMVDHGRLASLGDRQTLKAQIDTLWPEVNELVSEANGVYAQFSDQQRHALAQLLVMVGATLAVLLALLGTMIGALLNQTARLKSREEALIESQARVAATIRSSLDAVIVSDAAGRILEWNHGAERCFGYRREEVIGKRMWELIVPERFRAVHAGGVEAHSGRSGPAMAGRRIETEALHADGHEIPIELAIGVATGTRQPIFVAFVRDITERRRHEDELRAAVELAQSASRSKANFLAVMSHEMRTPLNGVIGTLDMLSRSDLQPEQRSLVDTAVQSGELLLAQINDVLDISKMDAGKLTLDNVPFDVHAMARTIVDIVATQARSAGDTVTLTISDTVPRRVTGDPIRLRQVMLNLVANAVKFTSHGTVAITLDAVADWPHKLTLGFAVRDTGIGIAEQRLGDLFQEFAMLDSSYSRRAAGTGLGLAICKRLIDAMGGRIGVSSREGAGSLFWFRVPLGVAAANEEESPTPASDAAPTMPPLAPQKILLVEDNITNLMVAHRMLTAAGHKVITATDGYEALDAAGRQPFDLILMDISMPEMDGLEATRRIRMLPAPYGTPPIVAMTAHAIAGDRERFLAAGMSDYVTKPIRLGRLLEAIRRVVGLQGPTDGGAGAEDGKTAQASPLPPVLDAEVLDELERETSPDALLLVLPQFIDELASRAADVASAIAAHDGERLLRAAHALSGLGATVGARRLLEATTGIEDRCRTSRHEEAFAQASLLAALLEETRGAYQAHLNSLGERKSLSTAGALAA